MSAPDRSRHSDDASSISGLPLIGGHSLGQSAGLKRAELEHDANKKEGVVPLHGVQPERPEKIEHTLSQGLIASVDDEHRLDLRCPPRRLSKPALPIGRR
jgi:hypothetical protein